MRFGFGGGAEGFTSPTPEQYILDVSTILKDLATGNLMARAALRRNILRGLILLDNKLINYCQKMLSVQASQRMRNVFLDSINNRSIVLLTHNQSQLITTDGPKITSYRCAPETCSLG